MMNMMLRLLPMATLERLGYGTGDLKGLTDNLKAEKDRKQIDRVKDAFAALKDMHKTTATAMPSWTQQGPLPQGTLPQNEQPPMMAAMDQPSPMDNAQWPHGPVGAPKPAPPILSEAQASPSPLTGFMRNASLQRDPLTGEYIDPTNAAKADPSVFRGLFA